MHTNCNQYRYAEQIGAILCADVGWTCPRLRRHHRGRDRPTARPAAGAASAAWRSLPTARGSSSSRPVSIVRPPSPNGGSTEAGRSAASWSTRQRPNPAPSVGFGYRGDDSALVVEFATRPDEQPVTHVIDADSGDVLERFPGVYGLLPTADPAVAVAFFDEDGTVGRFDLARREAVSVRRSIPASRSKACGRAATGYSSRGSGDDGRGHVARFRPRQRSAVGPTIEVDGRLGDHQRGHRRRRDVHHRSGRLDGASSRATSTRAT